VGEAKAGFGWGWFRRRDSPAELTAERVTGDLNPDSHALAALVGDGPRLDPAASDGLVYKSMGCT
jgi:hypothetical protein